MTKPYRNGLILLILLAIILAGAAYVVRGTPKEREQRYLVRGNNFFAAGEYEKAGLEYRNAARLVPIDAEVYYKLGLVSEAQGDINNAFAAYTMAEEQNGHLHPALLKLAAYYLAAERYDQVQKRLDIVLKDLPDDPEAHALHASLLLRQRDFAGTEKEAREALEKDPANITAISVLVGLYQEKGDPATAIKTVDVGIARNPHDVSLLILKAQLYEISKDLPKLLETYQAIFKLKPQEDFYRFHLADVLVDAGKLDEAESILRAGVAADPADWDIKRRLVKFLGDHRSVDAAEKEIHGYMQVNPKNNELYSWLADLYLSHNEVDRAIALLEEIIKKNQNDTQALNARISLARIDYGKGDKAVAEKIATFVLQKQSDNPGALYIRADIAFDQGRYQDALSDLRSITHVHPKNKEALQLLSEVYLRQGHMDLAIDTLSQLTEIDPLNYAAEVRLAQLYNQRGDSPRALELLADVTRSAPQYAVGWENMARIFIGLKDAVKAESAIHTLSGLSGQQMISVFLEGQIDAMNGDHDKAIANFTKVIDADPSSPLAEYALAALVKMQKSIGKLDEATLYIESLKTSSPYVSALLGKCYMALGKPDRAAAALDRAIAGNLADQEVYIDRAILYMNANKPDNALEVLKKAASIMPGDVRAPVMEAYILTKTGKYNEAIALYEDILEHNPSADIAANNMAAIIADYEYTNPEMLQKALQLTDRFANSSNPALLDTLEWVYYRQGNLSKALSLGQRAIELGAEATPQMHYHYGVILFKAGKPAEAKVELEKAVTDKADYIGLDEARNILKHL